MILTWHVNSLSINNEAIVLDGKFLGNMKYQHSSVRYFSHLCEINGVAL